MSAAQAGGESESAVGGSGVGSAAGYAAVAFGKPFPGPNPRRTG